jgi:3' exoribonuclease, RNase T-like
MSIIEVTEMHTMIDIETISTSHRAGILSIGAVKFDLNTVFPDTVEKLHNLTAFYAVCRPDLRHYAADFDTIRFWINEALAGNRAAVDEVFSHSSSGIGFVKIDVALEKFGAFLNEEPASNWVWGHGSTFDISILENAYRYNCMDIPWGYRAPRDTRTILDETEVEIGNWGIKHHALHDAIAQAIAIQRALRIRNKAMELYRKSEI